MSKAKPNQKQNTHALQKAQKNQKAYSATPIEQNNKTNTDFWKISFVLLATFCAFIPTFDNQFVNWDDPANITENPQLQTLTAQNFINIFTHNIMGGYNPLSIVTFFFEKSLFGAENLARIIHANNLLLHLLTTFFVWRLTIVMGLSRWSAFAVALLFGIHPMRVESVAWATERKDVLFGVFYFSALLNYSKYLTQNFQKKYLFYTAILFVFALFSKVQSVSLPLSMLVLDYWFSHREQYFSIKWVGQKIIEKWFFWLGALAMGIATITLLVEAKTIAADVVKFSWIERLMIASYTFFVYITKCIYPYIMSALYPYPSKIEGIHFYLSPLLVLGSVALLGWAYQKEKKILVFALLFFFVNFIFVSQIVGAGQAYLADRFTYVPYFGFFVLMASGFDLLRGGAIKTFVDIAFGIYMLVFFAMTWTQTKTWRDAETLWTQALKYENSATPFLNRGIYRREQKKIDAAIKDLQEAVRLSPKGNTLNSLAKTYFDLGKDDLAFQYYTKATAVDSTLAEVWINLGALHGRAGRADEALANVNKGISLDSTNKQGYSTRSLVWQMLQRFDLALADDQKFLSIDPSDPDIWFDSGAMKRRLNRPKEAIGDLDEAIRRKLKPEYFLERAFSHQALGNQTAARLDAKQAQAMGAKVPNELLQ